MKNKIALITGGSSGIGEATVREFVKEGAKVYFTYKSGKERAEKVSSDTGASALSCDTSKKEDCDKVIDAIMKEEGRIDILINSAGMIKWGEWGSEEFEEVWEEVLSVDLYGPMYLANKVIPEMKKNKYGRIVNVSSIHTFTAAIGSTAYQVAKAGLDAVTRSIAVECSKSNIRANSVAPGPIETPPWEGATVEKIERVKKHIPSGKFGKPEDVARTIRFLASDDSNYINGQTIFVDDGMLFNIYS